MEKDIEEVAEEYVSNETDSTLKLISKYSFKDGAKYQQSIMYSEADMLLAFETGRNYQLTGENNFKELITDIWKKKI